MGGIPMTRFLFRNLKGYRFLVIIAVLMTFAQVGADILLALPILYISNKIQFPFIVAKNPPPFLNPLISPFNRFASPQDQAAAIAHGVQTTIGVIFFSVTMLLVLSILSALLAYIGLYLASFIAQNLTARLRRQLFEHLQRLSLDWHGKQKKGDLVQRVTGDIANIEKLVTDGLVDLIAALLYVVGILLAIGTAIILGVGSYVAAGNTFTLGFLTIAAGTITIGTLFIFLGYLKMLYQPFRDFSKLTNLRTSASAGAERIQEVMEAA